MSSSSFTHLFVLTAANTFKLTLIVVSCCWLSLAHAEDTDWPEYLGGKQRDLYSSLDQINRKNVSNLEVAWTYKTGDAAEYQANNLIVDGQLYLNITKNVVGFWEEDVPGNITIGNKTWPGLEAANASDREIPQYDGAIGPLTN